MSNFFGLSPINFKTKSKAVFVCDYPTHLYLEELIEKEDHPSIMKFGGFSPVDFENNPNPVFLTEKSSKKGILFFGWF